MKKILKRICVFVIFAFVISITNVFALDTEVIRYGGKKSDTFFDAVIDGDYLIAVGESNSPTITGEKEGNQRKHDAIIVKYDQNNSIVWAKNYGAAWTDSFKSVIAISDGYIAVGSKSAYIDGKPDMVVTGSFVKFDKDGNIVWDNYYISSDRTEFLDIEKISSDEYIIIGQKYEGKVSIPIILKIDKTGNIIGEEFSLKELGYEDYDISKIMAVDENNSIVLLYKDDSVILNYNHKTGKIEWNTTYKKEGKLPVFEDVVLTSKGTYLVVGGNNMEATVEGLTEPSQDLAFMVEFDKDGNQIKDSEMIFNKYKQSRFNKILKIKNQYIVIGLVTNLEYTDSEFFEYNNFDVKLFKFDENNQLVSEENLGVKSLYMTYFTMLKQTDSDYFIVFNANNNLLDSQPLGEDDAAIIKVKNVFVEDNEDEDEKTLWERFIEEYKKTELVNLIGSFEKNSINITSTSDSLKIEFSNEKEKTITNFTYKDGIVTYVPASSEEGIISDGIWIANCIYALANLKGYDIELLNSFMDQDRKFTLEEDGVEFEILEYDSGEISGTTFSSFKLDIKNGLKSLSKFEKENDDTIVEKVPVPDTLSNPSVIAIAIGVLLIFGGVILYFGIIKNKLKKS